MNFPWRTGWGFYQVNSTKIALLALCAFILTVSLTAFGGGSSGRALGNTLNSKYESDRDNDGVINEVCCYKPGTDMRNKPLKKPVLKIY